MLVAPSVTELTFDGSQPPLRMISRVFARSGQESARIHELFLEL